MRLDISYGGKTVKKKKYTYKPMEIKYYFLSNEQVVEEIKREMKKIFRNKCR